MVQSSSSQLCRKLNCVKVTDITAKLLCLVNDTEVEKAGFCKEHSDSQLTKFSSIKILKWCLLFGLFDGSVSMLLILG